MSAKGNGYRRFARPDAELRRLMTLVALSRDGDRADSEDGLLTAALTQMSGVLPGHAIAIARYDDGEVSVPSRFVRGRLPVELARLLAALAIDRGEAVERQEEGGEMLAMPLLGSRGPSGALIASSARGPIADADHAMLEAMASQLGLTVDNLRLRRQLDRLLFRGH